MRYESTLVVSLLAIALSACSSNPDSTCSTTPDARNDAGAPIDTGEADAKHDGARCAVVYVNLKRR